MQRDAKNRTHEAAVLELLESRQLLSAATHGVMTPHILLHARSIVLHARSSGGTPSGGYTARQIRRAYGFDRINFNKGTNDGTIAGDGTGQTVAIVDAFNDPNVVSDLNTFDAQMGLPDAELKVVSQTGGPVTGIKNDAGWAAEIALDVEWAHAAAPGASILLVEANSDSLGDLLAAVNFAKSAPGVSTVSMSWGGSEFRGQTAYDSAFTTPAGHQGVTFITASGDNGSWNGAEWPAASPNVVSVGGTTLFTDAAGNYRSESAWSGSGGGFSSQEVKPQYQNIVQNGGVRSAPDVSYDADPNTGFDVYDSTPYQGSSGWAVVGGTSAGAPQWAGLIAVANQGRSLNHLGTLNGTSDTLPKLYSLYTVAQYSSNYHDVMTGASSWTNRAGYGYDAVSGLGSPKAGSVAQSLGASVTFNAPGAAARTGHIGRAGRTGRVGRANHVSPALVRKAQPIDIVKQQSPKTTFFRSPITDAKLVNTEAVSVHSQPAWSEDSPGGAQPLRFTAANQTSPPFSTTTIRERAVIDFTSTLWQTLAQQQSFKRVMLEFSDMGIRVARSLTQGIGEVSVISSGAKPSRVYNIAHMDGIDRFVDSLATFIADSIAVQPLADRSRSSRAWLITGTVLAVDAVLAGIWFQRRARRRQRLMQRSA